MFSPQFFKKISFLFLILFFPFGILAQTKTKVTVSPFLIEEKVFPGQNFIREIILTNESDVKANFSVLIQDISLDEKGGILFFPPKTQRFSLADWVEILEKDIEILPGESKRIKVHFKIPEKEAVGSRHGAIIFASKLTPIEQQREGVFATLSHQIGTLVFLYSTQEVREEAKISKFTTDKKIYFTPALIKFQIEIENLGNVYIEPSGKIEIESLKKKSQIIFNQERLKILPESKRIFEKIWQEKFGFGKYQATLYLVFGTPKNQGGSGVKTISAKTDFYIFPLKEFFFLILFLISFAFLISFLAKKYKKLSIPKNGN